VIFVDTSAVIAMLAKEPDGPALANKLEQARGRMTAAHVILESAMRLSSLFDLQPTAVELRVIALLRRTSTEVVPITEEIAHAAVVAFERYGKGRGTKANLNFGDCLSYAYAKAHGARLLFKGNDFSRTDIGRA
jgi:ribonuclease VapC